MPDKCIVIPAGPGGSGSGFVGGGKGGVDKDERSGSDGVAARELSDTDNSKGGECGGDVGIGVRILGFSLKGINPDGRKRSGDCGGVSSLVKECECDSWA